MKNLLLFLFFQVTLCLFAQSKMDYTWVFGVNVLPPINPPFGFTRLNFNAGVPDTTYLLDGTGMGVTNISVSDSTGKLLFQSNGCRILDANNNPLPNSNGLNTGHFSESCFGGYPVSQDMIAIPYPNNEGVYALYHLWLSNEEYLVVRLYQTLVKTDNISPFGRIIEKNKTILADTLSAGYLSANQHSNGRDWWIIVSERISNRYIKFLLTPNGVIGPFYQAIGTPWAEIDYQGQSCFSPDGTKYVKYHFYSGLYIYDFDRCTGEMSNPIYASPYDTVDCHCNASGVAISPNSRFLYVSNYTEVYQYDLWADDVISSRVEVASYSGEVNPYASTYFMAQLAPDGKIYLSCFSSDYVLHVIHQPNEKGDLCAFEKAGLRLPSYNYLSIPNFPNYRLGAADTPCDSIILTSGAAQKTPDWAVFIYPNPTYGKLTIETNASNFIKSKLLIYNALGELVFQKKQIVSVIEEIDISNFPEGVYWVRLESMLGAVYSQKIIKMKK
jgi:hypothetical protein